MTDHHQHKNVSIDNFSAQAAVSALQWYVDNGVIDAWDNAPQNRFELSNTASKTHEVRAENATDKGFSQKTPFDPKSNMGIPSINDKRQAAMNAVQNIGSLENLKQAITDFDGLDIKKTASNISFSSGDPRADIMIISEAPEADDDRKGVPFSGDSGVLLDKIIGSIGLSRDFNTPERSAYITHLINWRPPGGRTPRADEITIAKIFLEKHIALAAPKYILCLGDITAKTLLSSDLTLSKLRKSFHDFTPQTHKSEHGNIPTLVTYHPAYLLRTPIQKRAVWHDMLMLKDTINK